MHPAGEHFEADDLAVRKIHLRFEIRKELAVIETEADALLDLPVSDKCAFHAGIEPYRAGDATASGAIHGDIGAAQDVRNTGVSCERRRDAGKGANLDDPLVEHQRLGYRAQDGLRDLVGAVGLGRSKSECDGKFVPAEPCDDRVMTELRDESRGNRLQ